MDFSALLPRVIDLVMDAGVKILDIYQQDDLGIEYKKDDSPLTRADKAAHDVLVAGLDRLNCGPVLSEESASVPWDTRRVWTRYWLVDPLDGTKEFIKRNGEFTVNVALVDQGVPVLGVVYAPAKDLLYFGAQGQGAHRRDADGNEVAIKPAALPKADEVWRVVGSRSHQSEEFETFMKMFAAPEMVAMGSSLKLCLVADGSADLYPRLGPTSEWDTAAAQAVAEAAGAQVLRADTFEPLRYNSKDSLLNPYFIVCAAPAAPWYSVEDPA